MGRDVNRRERWLFYFMREHGDRIKITLVLPYWFVKLPVFVLALLLRHAAKKHADRMKA